LPRLPSFLVVLATYLFAGAVAFVTGWLCWGLMHPLLVALVADVTATLAVWLVSLGVRNASVYDPYWSVAPVPLAWFFLWVPLEAPVDPIRPVLVLLVLGVWAVRLTGNWATGWTGLAHVDWRYKQLARQTGALYPLVNLVGIQLFPTLLVYVGCLALWPALRSGTPVGWLDGVAVLVGLGAVAVEAIADLQMRAFVRNRSDAAAVMDRGLWGWSRHPNYLGEIGFWFALWLFALATGLDAAWTAVGWVAMVLLFVFISIPMMEKRQLDRKPGYADVRRRVPMLLPWRIPSRRASGPEGS